MIRPSLKFATPLFLLAAMASPALAESSITRTTPAESAVDAVFKRYDRKDTPGCSVAVIDDGKVLLKKSYGMADPSLGVPRTSATSHWIPYSEARVFVALAVAMLARDGKLTLDDPIRLHIPQVPAYASAVTVRQLLHHTSGLADYGVLDPGFDSMWSRVSEDEFFRVLTRWNKLGFAPGTAKMYSNTDYALLEMLVARVSGGSLHDYLHGKLLAPLGMASTRIGADQAIVHPGHTLFHNPRGDGFQRIFPYRTSPVGGISVTTSLDDLIRWERALRDPASGIASLMKQLEAGASPAGDDDQGYSFGVYPRTYRDLPLVEYRGVSGYPYLVQIPGTQLSVATLCNVYPGMESFGAEVARLYAAPPAAATDAAAAPKRILGPPMDVPAAELKRLAGEYYDVKQQAFLDVTLADGKLAIVPRGGRSLPPLVPLGNGQFKATLNEDIFVIEFKEVDGDMTVSSWDVTNNESGGNTYRRWTQWTPDAAALQGYSGTYIGDDVDVILHVRTQDGRVIVASRGFAEAALTPSDKPDGFFGLDIYRSTRFERDASGRVIAMVLDATRVQGIRFTRK